jgi:hypothetical protein
MLSTTLSLDKQRWGFVCFKVAVWLLLMSVISTGTTGVAVARPDAHPQRLAVAALTKLCTFTPKEYETGTVAERIKPYSQPQLYRQLKNQPSLMVETFKPAQVQQWKEAGGATAVTVRVTGEDHPQDTADSWARKIVCEQTRSGMEHTYGSVYLVVAAKKDQRWMLSGLKLLSSTPLD